jgi:hypothetical protein
MTAVTAAIAALLLAAEAAAQTRMPPRDAGSAGQGTKGTGVIRGRVIAADTQQPLRRARIRVSGPELGSEGRSTSTGADGKYELRELPAGRYEIYVSRSGYLEMRYGQRRPFELGKPLQLGAGETVAGVDFALPRMSVIAGRLVDEAGEPIPGVQVFAMRSMYFEGRRRMVPVRGGFDTVTDDTGAYRIRNLMPGSYYVKADTRETWTISEAGAERVMGYRPTYYPGTADVAHARAVRVTAGQETSAIDFDLLPGRAADVSGIAYDSLNRPLAGRGVSLNLESRGPYSQSFSFVATSTTTADGHFTFRNVSPGDYTVSAHTTYEADGATVEERAWMPLTVSGAPIENLALYTTTGWHIAGRVTTDTGEVSGLPRDRIGISADPTGDHDAMRTGPGRSSGRVREDWTFEVKSVPGPARLRVHVPDGWAVKALLYEGVDATDRVFELKSGETLGGVDVVLTNQVTVVSGTVRTAKGKPTLDCTVIVFAADRERWVEGSPHVRSARPDQQGRYEMRGLPPGDYLAVAQEYVEERMWNDPEYLASLSDRAIAFRLGDAEAREVPLTLLTP